MKITIESTTRIVNEDGIDCRVWEGETASGIKVEVLISRIAAREDQDLSQFERELIALIQRFPLRSVMLAP